MDGASFKVVFIPRPLEFSLKGRVDVGAEDYFDAMAPTLPDLPDLQGRQRARCAEP
jgi:hypothetical protein